jgi:hypothetical protein
MPVATPCSARGYEPADRLGLPERDHGDELERESAERHLAPAAVVGQLAHHEQRGQQRERVAGEHTRQHQRREAP